MYVSDDEGQPSVECLRCHDSFKDQSEWLGHLMTCDPSKTESTSADCLDLRIYPVEGKNLLHYQIYKIF